MEEDRDGGHNRAKLDLVGSCRGSKARVQDTLGEPEPPDMRRGTSTTWSHRLDRGTSIQLGQPLDRALHEKEKSPKGSRQISRSKFFLVALMCSFAWALHEKEESPKGSRQISRSKFFLVALMCSFAWYIVPGYLFPTLTSISWVCWVFSKSVTAQQLGSGMKGLGLGAFTLDWSAVSSFLFSPLISPFFATANIFVGYVCFLYVLVPTAYWWMNLYNAKTFPIFSSHLFMSNGSAYEITDIVNQQFQLDTDAYAKLGKDKP
ncbi:Oligopeptide transporter 4 [Hordeum vulgare]|nr:Oligopeptide transporter 4 [Hordeum vulgare]